MLWEVTSSIVQPSYLLGFCHLHLESTKKLEILVVWNNQNVIFASLRFFPVILHMI